MRPRRGRGRPAAFPRSRRRIARRRRGAGSGGDRGPRARPPGSGLPPSPPGRRRRPRERARPPRPRCPPTRAARPAPRGGPTRRPRLPPCAPEPPEPEGHRGGRALGIDHAHDAGLDAPDSPRRAAEEEYVALHALDCPVLVDGADRRVVRVGDDAIVGHPESRRPTSARRAGRSFVPAGCRGHGPGEGRRPGGRAPSGCRPRASPRPRRTRRGRGRRTAPRAGPGRRAGPRPGVGGAGGHDLLRQHVERGVRREDAVQLAGAHGAEQRRCLDELSRVVG